MTSNASPFDLTDRLAVVTGCRRGIGFAMAEALATAGADIIGVSANLERDDSAIEQRVRSLGRKFIAYQADLSDPTAVAELARDLSAHEPPVDILVNNAGTIRRAPAERHGDDDWDDVLGTNLSAPFRLAREVGRSMIEPRPREDHLHRVDAQLSGRGQRGLVRRGQVRDRWPDPRPSQ